VACGGEPGQWRGGAEAKGARLGRAGARPARLNRGAQLVVSSTDAEAWRRRTMAESRRRTPWPDGLLAGRATGSVGVGRA
jgi:hypothetical protein